MKALIFDVVRSSFVDGPGIRTTVFFKGCNLRCAWCHNPESQSGSKELFFYKDKCTGCGRCEGLSLDDEDFICLGDAKEICGKEYSVDEAFSEIVKDKSYYETSGGGVTFSGGECMLQIDFLLEILKRCKECGIHTAVDTAGHLPFEYFERIMPYTDLFLYDVKTLDTEVHKKYSGVGNELILENLKKLLKSHVCVWVRVPVISGVNDGEGERIKAFFKENGIPEKIELLPYHAMGEHKYASLGRECVSFKAPDEEKMRLIRKEISCL